MMSEADPPAASGATFPSPSPLTASSWVTAVTVRLTVSPSGSVAPATLTGCRLWFGGHSRLGLAATVEQLGGRFWAPNVQVSTDCAALAPPVAPVKPTKAVLAPTVAGMSTV